MNLWQKEKKHLSMSALIREIRKEFEEVEITKNRGRKQEISLTDCLMSGLAIFGFKFPSLLQFEKRRSEDFLLKENIENLYKVKRVPCDTQLRERLDEVDPKILRKSFTKVFAALQRGRVLDRYAFIDGHYLLLGDGTGFYSSKEVHCENCCVKHHRNGTKTYYHQMLGSAIVHPDYKEVIPLCPEPIRKEDGANKNDCEQNASKRFLRELRREHPHLPLILAEDALYATAPHLRLCKELNIRFITVVKPDGNKTLFEWIQGIERVRHEIKDEKGDIHRMEYIKSVPLNDSAHDLEVNYVEYWHISKGTVKYHNTWVTDLPVTKDNVYLIARGGRARWKIENETFNTLKNQGYHFEHNYGHGKKNLSTIMGTLMILAFLLDQVQQASSSLFRGALEKMHSKMSLWETIRNAIMIFSIRSWEALYRAIGTGTLLGGVIDDTS